jgi:hypothetical protein
VGPGGVVRGSKGGDVAAGDGVAFGVIPGVMGESWKPLKLMPQPRESSHKATGRVEIAVQGSLVIVDRP